MFCWDSLSHRCHQNVEAFCLQNEMTVPFVTNVLLQFALSSNTGLMLTVWLSRLFSLENGCASEFIHAVGPPWAHSGNQ